MFEFCIDNDTDKYNRIHFIGIGGISMSGLAEIMIAQNYKVSGSDSRDSSTVKRLRNLGAKVFIGHDKNNIKNDVDLIIYTDAVTKDNVELKEAKKNNISIIDRATFLGALMKNYKDSIAVSGTHGKTTTTSMLTTIFTNVPDLDPTILLGGQFKDIGGNVKLGSRDAILTEACEYKGNILKYFPTIGVILNMDEDHLDYFKSMDHIINTFSTFASRLDVDDHLIINNDDENKDIIIDKTKAKVFTFGLSSDAYYKAKDIKFNSTGTSFKLYINDIFKTDVKINLIGEHNLYNSLAAIATAHVYGISIDKIAKNIEKYSGVGRRLELKGLYKNIKIIDDYAHHPTEIRVTLDALKKSTNGDIFCVFQPHTYTRTKKLFNNFVSSFKNADTTIITDIYAARELNDGSVSSKELVHAINNKNTFYIKDFEDIKDFLIENAKPNDIIVTMGAGNINELGERILEIKSEAV